MARTYVTKNCPSCNKEFLTYHKKQLLCSRACNIVKNFGDFETRFWKRVDKSAGPEACWPWTASKRDSYGMVYVEGKPRQASRVAYELTYGPIPEGLIIRHKCDNPPCCNPNHLETGTKKQNAEDCINRGRKARGETSPQSKLTEAGIIYIRKADAEGVPQKQLAFEFEVTQGAISHICTRRTWGHVE